MTMTRSASLKYTTVEVWVTPDLAPVWVNSMAGNGATDDNRPPLSRIRAGSMRDPTVRTSMVPSALHANCVTTRWPNELLGRTVGPSSITGSLNESLVSDNGAPILRWSAVGRRRRAAESVCAGDEIGGLGANHDAWCVGMTADDGRHHRRIGDPQSVYSAHFESRCHDTGQIRAHPAGADRVIEGA